MRDSWEADRRLTAELQRLDDERLLVASLERLEQLTADTTVIDNLALTLTAARHLPDELTVRVTIGEGPADEATVAAAQHAMQKMAADASYTLWREANAVRSLARRQRPAFLGTAIVAVLVAYVAWYVSTEVDGNAVKVLFWLLGGLAITVAWVFSWLVVEDNRATWREHVPLARAHDLLSRARLEVVQGGSST